MLRQTMSPTTTSEMETSRRRPSRTTLTRMLLPHSSESLKKRRACRKLLQAETRTTRKTARKMLAPSYQPSLTPCSLMPNPNERAAQARRMRSMTFDPNSRRRSRRPASSPSTPPSQSAASDEVTPSTPPSSRRPSWLFPLTTSVSCFTSTSKSFRSRTASSEQSPPPPTSTSRATSFVLRRRVPATPFPRARREP
ncbi:unnamed protein product [Spirodela intermedia]|uniref:Uncharacterized protein n=1 Tax=Spirodela intermedia TaxID=51605 RepID=A0A7I8IPB2_SPIIN|nr:unnamed protein product [Spirodela intermedia]CAA6658981.1 unnamed protein product [Spirodela intermedia]